MNDMAIELDEPQIDESAGGARTILALDLGTNCGWALRDGNGVITGGTANFSASSTDRSGQRWLKFAAHLSRLKQQAGEIHAVYYEDVKNHTATQAAHVYGAFEAQVQIFCDINRIRLYGVGVGTVKKHWTGKGNAKKEEMVLAARAKGFRPVDDNHADALAILDYAITKERD
ncbi:polynucleotidyl transferase [Robbsia sp. KACC 23696]|uniref:polynucleotidyl transferase n=1 Tax=Robbsia sp. KACC 23696 TaxID=3149231 RepID=UPI00325B390F